MACFDFPGAKGGSLAKPAGADAPQMGSSAPIPGATVQPQKPGADADFSPQYANAGPGYVDWYNSLPASTRAFVAAPGSENLSQIQAAEQQSNLAFSGVQDPFNYALSGNNIGGARTPPGYVNTTTPTPPPNPGGSGYVNTKPAATPPPAQGGGPYVTTKPAPAAPPPEAYYGAKTIVADATPGPDYVMPDGTPIYLGNGPQVGASGPRASGGAYAPIRGGTYSDPYPTPTLWRPQVQTSQRPTGPAVPPGGAPRPSGLGPYVAPTAEQEARRRLLAELYRRRHINMRPR